MTRNQKILIVLSCVGISSYLFVVTDEKNERDITYVDIAHVLQPNKRPLSALNSDGISYECIYGVGHGTIRVSQDGTTAARATLLKDCERYGYWLEIRDLNGHWKVLHDTENTDNMLKLGSL